MNRISADVPYAVLDSIVDNDSSYILQSDIQKKREDADCRILQFLLYNMRRNVQTESRWDYMKRSIRHYTSPSTIANACEYLRLYFRKN